jgi:hypothetical protein
MARIEDSGESGVDRASAVEEAAPTGQPGRGARSMKRPMTYAWALGFFVIGAFPAVASAGMAPKSVGGLDCMA